MIIIAVVVIAGAFGGWYFFLRGAAALPSSWVASRSANGVGEAYYLHWETNGDNLKGSIEFAYISKSTTQSVTEPVTGTYNSQDHSVTLTYSGITSPIIKGTIINNNTLTLSSNDPHMMDAITFYAGDYNEYLHEINDLKGKLS